MSELTVCVNVCVCVCVCVHVCVCTVCMCASVKSKGVTTQMSALNEYFLMVVFM